MSIDWTAPTSADEAARRAGGRRHYNNHRKMVAMYRRMKVRRLLDRYPDALFARSKAKWVKWGAVNAIATELRVSPATISRDIKWLFSLGRPCPQCGHLPPLRGGRSVDGLEDDCQAVDLLDLCDEDFRRGEWQWAARGPLPPPRERPAAE